MERNKYYSQTDECKEKIKETCDSKYGVSHPFQVAEIAEKASKNAYKSYDYVLPSGKIVKLQGYEKFAMDILFSQGFAEDDIVTKRTEVPKITYNDSLGATHRYYIDIFITSLNKGIEVKSTWTFSKKQDKIRMTYKAFKEAGHYCEIWIISPKGKIIEILDDPVVPVVEEKPFI